MNYRRLLSINSKSLTVEMDVLRFWFEELTPAQWFTRSDKLDMTIQNRFGDILRSEDTGRLSSLCESDSGLLALVIIFDQFPRNIYRGKPEAFSYDDKALICCEYGISKGYHMSLDSPMKKLFMLMPLMHQEDIDCQNRLIRHLKDLKMDTSHAEHHKEEIRMFGRFPHRNPILGRESTPEEHEYVLKYGSR